MDFVFLFQYASNSFLGSLSPDGLLICQDSEIRTKNLDGKYIYSLGSPFATNFLNLWLHVSRLIEWNLFEQNS